VQCRGEEDASRVRADNLSDEVPLCRIVTMKDLSALERVAMASSANETLDLGERDSVYNAPA
jgi:hypothetical protein